jgi:hypothetical protein
LPSEFFKPCNALHFDASARGIHDGQVLRTSREFGGFIGGLNGLKRGYFQRETGLRFQGGEFLSDALLFGGDVFSGLDAAPLAIAGSFAFLRDLVGEDRLHVQRQVDWRLAFRSLTAQGSQRCDRGGRTGREEAATGQRPPAAAASMTVHLQISCHTRRPCSSLSRAHFRVSGRRYRRPSARAGLPRPVRGSSVH